MDKTLDLQLSLFDEICMNPVQLSTLIAMVGSRDGAEMPTLPSSIFELYQGAVVATLRTALEDLAPESVALARETLQLVAVANQRADGRRVFTGEDVNLALDSAQHREVWWKWVEQGTGQDAIPLVRILATATDRAGFEFQFTHISLQEFFFASELASATDSSFWGERGASASFQLNKFLNQNLFRIGGATLGRTLAANAIFDQPVMLTTIGFTNIELLLNSLSLENPVARVDLSDSPFEASPDRVARAFQGVVKSELRLDRCRALRGSLDAEFWASLTSLEVLSLEECRNVEGKTRFGGRGREVTTLVAQASSRLKSASARTLPFSTSASVLSEVRERVESVPTQNLTSPRAGAIPASIGNLVNLQSLSLWGNALSGA